jgi:hypothetical protein
MYERSSRWLRRAATRGPSPGLRWAPRRRRPVARRYLRAGLSLEQFFDQLNERGVRYVVLRWFESLPDVEPGEDIDLLVADEDLAFVGTLLTSHHAAPRRQKFDVYTVSGLPGSDHHGIPYFTPDLAHAALERSVLLRGRYRVPSPQDHFDSLAYHAVYHKGWTSGLPESKAVDAPIGTGEHDYAAVLAELAENIQLSVPLTMKDLDAYLADKRLRPPLDTLDKLSAWNGWLRGHLEEEFGPAEAGTPGVAVFVLRERAGHLLGQLREELRREGWEPLETISLDPATAARVTAAVRGGTWGRGPWPVSGGGPVAYVIAYDLSTSVPDDATPADPDRVNKSKLAIRRRLLNGTPAGERFNPLHSSDNPRQALDYLALLQDDQVLACVEERIARIRAEMVFPFPVVEILPSRRRRAVIAVVRHPVHGECVCKLFYPGADRFRRRELRARTEFAALPEVPTLLEAGPNWLLTTRYIDTRAHVRRQMPRVRRVQLKPSASLALARMARVLHDHGTFLLDLTPQNLLSDRTEGLKVLDWEFLQDFPGDKPDLARSPTVLGHAVGLAGVDTPLGVSSRGESAVTVFHPTVTGTAPGLLLRVRPGRQALLMEPGMLAALFVPGLLATSRQARSELPMLARRAAKKLLRHLEGRATATGRPEG